MKTTIGQTAITFLCLIVFTSASPVRSPSVVEMEEHHSESQRTEPEQQNDGPFEEEDAVDPRISEQNPDYSIGSFHCTKDSQCSNGGVCVRVGKTEQICNCTKGHAGPYCDYAVTKDTKTLRLHPLFKTSFGECMTRSGSSVEVNPASLFEKCGSEQNVCWFQEGGAKGLKCFLWCLSNSMRLTEDKPSEESRLHLYEDVFQKFERERKLPPGKPQSQPRNVPVASFEVRPFGDPNPESTDSTDHQGSDVTIKPTVIHQTAEEEDESPYAPASSYDDAEYDPYLPPFWNYPPPRSHELTQPDYSDSYGDSNSPLNFSSLMSNNSDYPYGSMSGSGSGPPSDHFPNNTLQHDAVYTDGFHVVEGSDSTEETEETEETAVMMSPFFDFNTNMRAG